MNANERGHALTKKPPSKMEASLINQRAGKPLARFSVSELMQAEADLLSTLVQSHDVPSYVSAGD